MGKRNSLIIAGLLMTITIACGSSDDVQPTSTLIPTAAEPAEPSMAPEEPGETESPPPTDTSAPTNTVENTATSEPEPSETAEPPTETSSPVPTATAPPPTDTPRPTVPPATSTLEPTSESPTSAPLPTDPPATETPLPTIPPAPTETSVPAPPPAPASCDTCSYNAYNCGDFNTHDQAQACHDYCMEQVGYDVHKLDGSDNDGLACESLP